MHKHIGHTLLGAVFTMLLGVAGVSIATRLPYGKTVLGVS